MPGGLTVGTMRRVNERYPNRCAFNNSGSKDVLAGIQPLRHPVDHETTRYCGKRDLPCLHIDRIDVKKNVRGLNLLFIGAAGIVLRTRSCQRNRSRKKYCMPHIKPVS